MIQAETILRVADNSGAKTVKCLKVLGGFKKKYASIGDIIVVVIRALRNRRKYSSKVKRKEIYKALILRVANKIKSSKGFETKFNTNAVTLINKNGNPIGTRVIGPVVKKLIKKKFQRFASIAPGTL